MYQELKLLKNMDEAVKRAYWALEARKDGESNNVAIICRSPKDCRKALKGMAKNLGGKANVCDLVLKLKDREIYFIPANDVEMSVAGHHYKDFIFEEE